jgi:hypothetical protein
MGNTRDTMAIMVKNIKEVMDMVAIMMIDIKV